MPVYKTKWNIMPLNFIHTPLFSRFGQGGSVNFKDGSNTSAIQIRILKLYRTVDVMKLWMMPGFNGGGN
jgi:hypothetical protein